MERADGRKPHELRVIEVHKNYVSHPEGSVLFSMGDTRVLCNVTIENGVPRWMDTEQGSNGWITAEYSMLPRATHTRNKRETNGLRGRTQEISRLIGRALRSSVDLSKLGQFTCIVDCDVIQADGGTRTASITGGYIALRIALQRLIEKGKISSEVFLTPVAAISVGMVDGSPVVDLCYEEDSRADVDANLVINERGEIIEFQGTSERTPLARSDLNILLNLGQDAAQQLIEIQKNSF